MITGKERDQETGLDWFASRCLSSAQGRFTSADNPKFSEKTDRKPGILYAYVGNNPLSRTDPLGHNWFYLNGKWEWHQGNTYTYQDKKGHEHTAKSGYTHLLVFQQVKMANGVAVGVLSLYGNADPTKTAPIKQTIARSGGAEGNSPIAGGNYEINLNNRGGVDTNRMISNLDANLAPFHNGIQEVGQIPIPGYDATADFRGPWGTQRAHLMPLQGQDVHYYLHGKWDYPAVATGTHGCITDPYQIVVGKLFELDPRGVGEGAKTGRVAVSVQRTQ